ncbi:MAG: glucose-6-phosphate isomerase [Chitinivibrionales bacterium]|nr:glucose-6-phosphate isomerase [Chitinivibrionales bacterium]
MQRVTYDDKTLSQWIASNELEAYEPALQQAEQMLTDKSGPGNDYLGWLNLPAEIDAAALKAVSDKANEIRDKADVLVCVGIGGSYLGARATIEALPATFEDTRKPRVIFAGHNVNSDYLNDLLALLENHEVAVNVISKSGTTTEPGIAFRVIRSFMERKYGRKGAAERTVATTDPAKGALRTLADTEGYASFAIPPDVGGRFSVLTPVGLFPIAVAGIDIAKLVDGAREAMALCSGRSIEDNMAGRYAAVRNILFRRGKAIEVLAAFQPQLHFVSEWWKQLAGESEGKNLTGIFPAALDYTTDLHSLGQWMQDGVRNVFETFMVLGTTQSTVTVPKLDDDGDGLNYLAGTSFEDVNMNAYKGTLLAHMDGGVPCASIRLADRTPETLGQLFYFFEKAVALSGYMLRVNPFDQPGVEAYKKNMFALLGKSGFQDRADELQTRLKEVGL